MSRNNEAELVRRAQAGETQAFAELVMEHQHFVYNLALRSLGNAQEAEDVAQEALVRAWLALPRFRGQSRFQTWLYRIVVNLCFTRLPRLKRELEALGEEQALDLPSESFSDPAVGLERAEERAFLHRQIETLPESYRLLVSLRFQQELSYQEIAAVVNLPLGTVKVGIFRARQRLREAWHEYTRERTI